MTSPIIEIRQVLVSLKKPEIPKDTSGKLALLIKQLDQLQRQAFSDETRKALVKIKQGFEEITKTTSFPKEKINEVNRLFQRTLTTKPTPQPSREKVSSPLAAAIQNLDPQSLKFREQLTSLKKIIQSLPKDQKRTLLVALQLLEDKRALADTDRDFFFKYLGTKIQKEREFEQWATKEEQILKTQHSLLPIILRKNFQNPKKLEEALALFYQGTLTKLKEGMIETLYPKASSELKKNLLLFLDSYKKLMAEALTLPQETINFTRDKLEEKQKLLFLKFLKNNPKFDPQNNSEDFVEFFGNEIFKALDVKMLYSAPETFKKSLSIFLQKNANPKVFFATFFNATLKEFINRITTEKGFG